MHSFLKYIGGLNKGRLGAEDLERADDFAQRVMEKMKE